VVLYIRLMVSNKQGTLGDDAEADTVRVFINSLSHEAREFADTLN